jgi:UPF0176 protein
LPGYEPGVSCRHCIDRFSDGDRARFRERQRQMQMQMQRSSRPNGG